MCKKSKYIFDFVVSNRWLLFLLHRGKAVQILFVFDRACVCVCVWLWVMVSDSERSQMFSCPESASHHPTLTGPDRAVILERLPVKPMLDAFRGISVTICFANELMRRMITLSFTSQWVHENVCASFWTVSLYTYLKACHGSAGAQACDWTDCKWGGMTLTTNPIYFYHLPSHSEWTVIATPYIPSCEQCFMWLFYVRLLCLISSFIIFIKNES